MFHGGACKGGQRGDGVPARARRASCAGGRVCHRVPPRVRMGSRWLPRRRHVLRPLRLPDHEPAPRRSSRRAGRHRPSAASGRGGRGASSRRSSSCSLRSRRTPRGGRPPEERGAYGATGWRRSSTRRTGGSSSRTTRTSTCSLRRRSLEHTWSLAIEEQFYLLWPVVVVRAWRSAGAGERHSRRFATVGVVASALLMAWLGEAAIRPARTSAQTHGCTPSSSVRCSRCSWNAGDSASPDSGPT